MTTTQIQRAISLVCGAYGAALLLHLLMRLVPGERPWWWALAENFTQWYFVPLLLLVPLALVMRARRGLLLMLPVTAVGIAWYLPYVVPRAQAEAEQPTLKVVTMNIWGANAAFAADDANYQPMADWLRTLDADIVLLQEAPLSQRTRTDGYLGLADLYPYQTTAVTEHWTNAMLSRWPIIESESHEPTSLEPRRQRAVIDYNGEQIAIYNIHIRFPIFPPRITLPSFVPYELTMPFGYDEQERNTQIRYVLDWIEDERLPFIVGGDFNMSDQSLMYSEVSAVLTDSFRAVGRGPGTSWPIPTEQGGLRSLLPPLIRIDYLWHGDDWQTVRAEQGVPLGSDHLPLIGEFALER